MSNAYGTVCPVGADALEEISAGGSPVGATTAGCNVSADGSRGGSPQRLGTVYPMGAELIADGSPTQPAAVDSSPTQPAVEYTTQIVIAPDGTRTTRKIPKQTAPASVTRTVVTSSGVSGASMSLRPSTTIKSGSSISVKPLGVSSFRPATSALLNNGLGTSVGAPAHLGYGAAQYSTPLSASGYSNIGHVTSANPLYAPGTTAAPSIGYQLPGAYNAAPRLGGYTAAPTNWRY